MAVGYGRCGDRNVSATTHQGKSDSAHGCPIALATGNARLGTPLGLTRSFGFGAAFTVLLGLSATLMAVAIGSAGYWWLGWFPLVPLFLSIRLFTPARAAAAGAFWGACLYAASGGVVASVIPRGISSLGLLVAIPALYAYVGCLISRRKGFNPFLLGLGWAGVELALHPLAPQSGLLGGGPLVLTVGHLGGYVLVAFLVAAGTAAMLAVLHGRRVVATQPPRVRLLPLHRRMLPLWEDLVVSFESLELTRPRPPPAYHV